MIKNILNKVAIVLLIVGGINWGLFGLLEYNLVAELLETGILSTVIYTLIGLSAIWEVYALFTHQ